MNEKEQEASPSQDDSAAGAPGSFSETQVSHTPSLRLSLSCLCLNQFFLYQRLSAVCKGQTVRRYILSQDHKYVIKAEVLYKSWLLDEAELTFIQKLIEAQRNEMRGRVKNTTPESATIFSCK